MFFSSSIMTKPFAVMTLLLAIRLCGNNLCEAWICCSTTGLLQAAVDTSGVERLANSLLVDSLKYVKDDIVSQTRVCLFEFRESPR